MSDTLRKEVEAKNTLSDEELYVAFLGDKEGALFSPEGRVIEGRSRFQNMLSKYKPAVCDAYRKHGKDIPEGVTVAVGIATALSPALAATGLPLVPFCVLVVRHGLGKLCEGEEPSDG
jgi:hypothetical protein